MKTILLIWLTLTASFACLFAVDDEDFKAGIGFYIQQDGKFYPLYWPVTKGQEFKTESVIKSKTTDRIYSFGMDFSKSSALGFSPVPPHLAGYSWGYFEPDGTKKGVFPLRFQPVEGAKQPIYEVLFDGPMNDLNSGKIPYSRIYFKIGEAGSYVLVDADKSEN